MLAVLQPAHSGALRLSVPQLGPGLSPTKRVHQSIYCSQGLQSASRQCTRGRQCLLPQTGIGGLGREGLWQGPGHQHRHRGGQNSQMATDGATCSLGIPAGDMLVAATTPLPQEQEYYYDSDDSVLDLDAEFPDIAEWVVE